jgi:hypothetical protein
MKPTIRYSEVLSPPVVGQSAVIVLAEQHHTISQMEQEYHENVVTTSTVLEVDDDGSFETRNTLYVRE